MKRKTGIAIVALALALVGAGIVLSVTSLVERGVTVGGFEFTRTEAVDRAFAVTGIPTLNVESGDGNITIVPGDAGTVAIHAIKKASIDSILRNLSVEMTQEGDTITVHATKTGTAPLVPFGNNSGVVDYEVRLPAHAHIGRAKTGDGRIEVSGIAGRLNLDTSDGAIRVNQFDGDLQAHTGDGSITLTSGHGTVRLNTGDGRITMREVRSEGLDIHSGDGSVTFEGSFAIGSMNRFESGDGAIAIAIPPESGLRVDIHTGDGGLRVGFPVVTQDNDARKRNSLQGVIGNPDATLTVRTSDGSITLTAQQPASAGARTITEGVS